MAATSIASTPPAGVSAQTSVPVKALAPSNSGSTPIKSTKTLTVTVSEVHETTPKPTPAPAPAGPKDPAAHEGYKLVKVRKPDGTIVTVKRPIQTDTKKTATGPAAASKSTALSQTANATASKPLGAAASVPEVKTSPALAPSPPAPVSVNLKTAGTIVTAPLPPSSTAAGPAAPSKPTSTPKAVPITPAPARVPAAAPTQAAKATGINDLVGNSTASNIGKAIAAVNVDNINHAINVTSHLARAANAVVSGDLGALSNLAQQGLPPKAIGTTVTASAQNSAVIRRNNVPATVAGGKPASATSQTSTTSKPAVPNQGGVTASAASGSSTSTPHPPITAVAPAANNTRAVAAPTAAGLSVTASSIHTAANITRSAVGATQQDQGRASSKPLAAAPAGIARTVPPDSVTGLAGQVSSNAIAVQQPQVNRTSQTAQPLGRLATQTQSTNAAVKMNADSALRGSVAGPQVARTQPAGNTCSPAPQYQAARGLPPTSQASNTRQTVHSFGQVTDTAREQVMSAAGQHASTTVGTSAVLGSIATYVSESATEHQKAPLGHPAALNSPSRTGSTPYAPISQDVKSSGSHYQAHSDMYQTTNTNHNTIEGRYSQYDYNRSQYSQNGSNQPAQGGHKSYDNQYGADRGISGSDLLLAGSGAALGSLGGAAVCGLPNSSIIGTADVIDADADAEEIYEWDPNDEVVDESHEASIEPTHAYNHPTEDGYAHIDQAADEEVLEWDPNDEVVVDGDDEEAEHQPQQHEVLQKDAVQDGEGDDNEDIEPWDPDDEPYEEEREGDEPMEAEHGEAQVQVDDGHEADGEDDGYGQEPESHELDHGLDHELDHEPEESGYDDGGDYDEHDGDEGYGEDPDNDGDE